jgi:FAD-dependent oxidoreductase domain-containing protein 1
LPDFHVDVLVVGAGVLGIASAFHLQSNNPSKKILVIDNLGGPGQAGTGRSAAMFRNTFTSYDNQVLANSSIEYYLSLQRGSGVDLGLELVGYLWLMSDRQFRANAKNVEKMTRNGIELRTYTRDELRQSIAGISTTFDSSDPEAAAVNLEDVDAAVFGVKCGKLEPDRLTKFYYNQFTARGGQSRFNTRATGLLIEPRKKLGIEGEPFIWQEQEIAGVQTKGLFEGEIYAEKIVLAGGAWNNVLLEPIGLDGYVKSKKRQIFQISVANRPKLREMLFTKGFNDYGVIPFVVLPKCGIYAKPVRMGEQLWIGCDDELNRAFIDTPDFDPARYTPEPSYYQNGVYPVLSSYFPHFRDINPSGMWAGLIAYNTLDYLPYVFESGGNLIVVGGDSGSGIMKADSLGRVVEALYRLGPDSEALLYGNVSYPVSKLGVKKRSVEREEWVL